MFVLFMTARNFSSYSSSYCGVSFLTRVKENLNIIRNMWWSEITFPSDVGVLNYDTTGIDKNKL